MKKSLISLTGVAVLGAFGLLPVSEALADHPAGSGGKFTVHINRDISGFDHIKVPQGGMGRYQVLYAVHDKLFSKDANGKTIPRLATKATHSDDFKNWRVTLRKGVRFSNGEELTSEAYVHHFTRLLGHRLRGRFQATIGSSLQRVVAIDKYTMEFQFKNSNLAFQSVMENGIYTWYLNAPGFAKANENKPDYNRMSVGAGPYMVKDWIPGKGVTLVRNPNYWNPAEQHADEIFYRITTGPESAGNWNAIRAGDLDASWSLNGSILPRAMKNKNLTVLNGGRGQLHWAINFMQSYKPLDDVRVRRALAHATNRAAIIKVITKGMAKPADQAFPPSSKWHCQGIAYPEFDVAKAKALLAEYGKPIPTFELWTLNIPSFKKLAVMLQNMWKKVGVNVNIKTGGRGPTGVVFKIVKGETPIWMNPRGSYIHPTVIDTNLLSTAKDNIWRAKSPKLDAAILAIQAAKNDAELKIANCAFAKAKTEVVPYLPFEYAIAAIIHQKNIGGLTKPNDTVLGYHHIFRKK